MAHSNEREIRELLDLYFEGETTLEQEEALRGFFGGDDIPEDLLYAKAMFGGIAALRNDVAAKAVSVPAGEMKAAPAKKRSRALSIIYRSVSVAAAVVVVTLVAVKFVPEKPTVYCYLNGQPVTDINVAERQADMAVRLLEGSVKASADGIATVKEASKPVERIGRALQMVSAMAGIDAEE